MWTSSKAVEAVDDGRSPFRAASWGIPIGVSGFVVMFAAAGALVATTPATLTDLDGLGTGSPWLIVLALVGLLGAALGGMGMFAAEWRLWKFVGTQERRLGTDSPLNPKLMVGLLVVGSFPGYVSFVGYIVAPLAFGYVLYRTQRGLNRIWQHAASA